MKVSLNVLNQYVQVKDIEPSKLADLVTAAGFEVEGVEKLAYGTNLVIGYVKECVMHPDSDHLHVCQVEVAPGVVNQIVCGAPNVAAGQKVMVALPGCELAGGLKIKESVIRGQASNGMICSLSEIGIDARFQSEEQKAGIEILDESAPVGEEALAYLGLDDDILDISLTPNRADCMSLIAFAYEVGAVLKRDVTLPKATVKTVGKGDIQVATETKKCPYFGAKLVKGVKTHESPQWLKTALMASGIKPINNVVDISNYVMLETGQPIHMYDYDKMKEKQFIVKTGLDHQATLLDGQKYQLEKEDVIVCVDGDVGCIAGVMGSDSTKIEDNSTNIVIEVATFNGASLRKTARRLNLLTDASQRFIKNAIDTASSLHTLDRVAELLVELSEAREVYDSVETAVKPEPIQVSLRENRANELLGTAITTQEIADIFDSLKFDYTLTDGKFVVNVPTHRHDITLEADLVEEVARLYGYDHIPSTLPIMASTTGVRTPVQQRKMLIKNLLSNLGLQEIVTYTLVTPAIVEDFNYFHKDENVCLMSPLGEERSVTRKSVMPSMLQAVNYNQSRSNKDVNIFEISNTYTKDSEICTLGIACSGTYLVNKWQKISKEADFYLVKGFVEAVFKKLGIEESRYVLQRVESDNPYLHPGRSGYLYINKQLVGYIGQVHPTMAKKYEIADTFVAELNLNVIAELKTKKLKYEAVPQYPSVTRDIALVVDVKEEAYAMIRTIKRASKRLVKDAIIFDVYQGEHIEEGKKSIAVNLIFQDPTKTLGEAEVNECLTNILTALQKDHQAILRG